MLLEVTQRFAHGEAADREALAQARLRSAGAGRPRCMPLRISSRSSFGDLQIARPARRTQAGAVAVFLVGTAAGVRFGHNATAGSGDRHDGHDNKAAGGAGTARRDPVPDPALAGERAHQCGELVRQLSRCDRARQSALECLRARESAVRARSAQAADARRASGSVRTPRRRAGVDQGQSRRRRPADALRHAGAPARGRARRARRRASAPRRRGDSRQDPRAGRQPGRIERESAHRRGAQSVAPRIPGRRLVGRRRCGGCCRPVHGRDRHATASVRSAFRPAIAASTR